jgi:hypothetical protein
VTVLTGGRTHASGSVVIDLVECGGEKKFESKRKLGWLCSSDCALGREASRIPCQGVVNYRREGRRDGGVANELPNFKREVR